MQESDIDVTGLTVNEQYRDGDVNVRVDQTQLAAGM